MEGPLLKTVPGRRSTPFELGRLRDEPVPYGSVGAALTTVLPHLQQAAFLVAAYKNTEEADRILAVRCLPAANRRLQRSGKALRLAYIRISQRAHCIEVAWTLTPHSPAERAICITLYPNSRRTVYGEGDDQEMSEDADKPRKRRRRDADYESLGDPEAPRMAEAAS